jgi:hypothetical protein
VLGRYVCITGMSHSGSTLLSGLFYNVPGAIALGETHWLLHREDVPYLNGCSLCKNDCYIHKKLKKKELSWDNLYQKLLAASGKRFLVTSDKAIGSVRRLTKPRTARGVHIFRRPEAMFATAKRHQVDYFPRFHETYQKWHNGWMHWGPKHFTRFCIVNYEDLSKQPLAMLKKICRSLELPQPRNLVFPPREWHNIGGNTGTYGSDRVYYDDRWRRDLSDAEQRFVSGNQETFKVWETLKRRAL